MATPMRSAKVMDSRWEIPKAIQTAIRWEIRRRTVKDSAIQTAIRWEIRSATRWPTATATGFQTAILMREHGIKTIYTRDTDFHRFPFLEPIDPLA